MSPLAAKTRAVLLLGPLALLSFLPGCGLFIGYTVVNQTDERLESWVFYEDCERRGRYREDYDFTRVIEPQSIVEVAEIVGGAPSQPWCVQVVDSSGRLIHAEPYPDHACCIYVTIDEPLRRAR